MKLQAIKIQDMKMQDRKMQRQELPAMDSRQLINFNYVQISPQNATTYRKVKVMFIILLARFAVVGTNY